jgi:hypothetical protein
MDRGNAAAEGFRCLSSSSLDQLANRGPLVFSHKENFGNHEGLSWWRRLDSNEILPFGICKLQKLKTLPSLKFLTFAGPSTLSSTVSRMHSLFGYKDSVILLYAILILLYHRSGRVTRVRNEPADSQVGS